MDVNNSIRYIHTDEKFVEFWETYFNNHNWLSPDEKIGIYIDFLFVEVFAITVYSAH